MAETRPAPPHGRYRRSLDGADFSLEANTENVPDEGKFYVMRAGKVVVGSEDFDEATNAYHALCRDFWMERLESESIPIRVSAAWGLLGLDSADKNAIAVITRDSRPSPPPPVSTLIVPPTWYPVTLLSGTVVAPASTSAVRVPLPLSWLCHQEYGAVRPTTGFVTLRRTYAGPLPNRTPSVLPPRSTGTPMVTDRRCAHAADAPVTAGARAYAAQPLRP